ncbi:probable F420-dependent oxidoreductase, MSMEG_2256 family [Actinacidiphila yanglinensis]|uniref:Probable F420-dependent oxidoreductase, MSMEG_2256 family n=1 Tax=Actinacidiphila yanglinensis TaxID=310779 RepID=A0A1H6CP97_9ACTN|nr:TIGR03617 family F420-dependent LLM class oxidoreductase [Actinacidiphila yanglinensis]SEG74810.1 probable F420-dependent oxidoreductase, MSMEG_2256 family [Actinacidiphila yanglinensis]
MLIDAPSSATATPLETEAEAVAAEAAGYDGFGASETRHDVFTALALAARATSRISLQSSIAVAFARNPMSVAIHANDLQLISGGRFQLGLGSQVRPHIVRRFNMPWSSPAARMEEFVTALRAIWSTWSSGERLMFRGEFYEHTLMTDFFNPGPNPYGNPPIMLAGVGRLMTAVAGRSADGMLCHSLTTESYLRELTLPVLREARGGSLNGFTVGLPALVVLGADEKERTVAERAVRERIAFYASTPSYLPVLEHHGWGDLHKRLTNMSRRGEWEAMGAEIDDAVLDAFAVSGDAKQVATALSDRFGSVVDRLSLYLPYSARPELVGATAQALRTF